MKVAIRLENGNTATFHQEDSDGQAREWGYAEWAQLAREADPQVKTVLVQVK